MLLKKIEIFGFKSFSDKVEIELSPGVTGIIGPNGCGKSNIADAVRWCLGEQSIKTLRGSRMEDVIFNGTDVRKPISFAEVSLLFDNLKPEINLDFTEVNVTRRLFRSGESDYLLNKAPCRLKEITELFHDTGVGKESYSFIGQGKIDQILSARPQDRRSIFEEAAGVYKYKSRKKETLRRLKETADNLLRVSDLIEELNHQLGPMEEQALIAKEYINCRDRLKHLEIGVLSLEIREVSQKKLKLQEKLEKLSLDIFKKYSLINRLDSDIAEQKYKSSTAEEEISELREKLHRVEGSLKIKNSDTELYQEKLKNLQNQIKELELAEGEYTETLSAVEEKKAGIKANLLELDDTAAKLVQDLVQMEKHLQKLECSAAETTEKIEQALNDILHNLEEKSLKFKKTQLEQEYLKSRLEEIIKDTDVKKAQQVDLENKKTHAQNTLSEKKEILQAREKEYEESIRELRDREGRVSSKQEEFRDIQGQLEQSRAYLEALWGMQEKLEGFNEAVKTVLKAKKQNHPSAKAVEGVVADLLQVPENLEKAVEAALGSAAQNIVTRDESTAKEMISMLKELKKGRATFLPLSLIVPVIQKNPSPKEKGIIGWARELVSFDSGYERVFDRLLGSVLIAEDLDSALAAARKLKMKYKIVTLEGEIIFPGGAITGGSYKHSRPGFISRKNAISSNEQKKEKLENMVQQLKSELGKMIKEKNALEELGKEKAEHLHRSTRELQTFEEEFKSLQDIIRKTDKSIKDLEEQKKIESGKIAGNNENQIVLKSELQELKRRRESLEAELIEEKALLQESQHRRTQIDKEAARLKVEIASANREKQMVNEKLQDLDQEREILKTRILKVQQKTGELVQSIKELNFSIKRTEKEIKQLEQTQDTVSNKFSRLREKTGELTAELTENENQVKTYRRALQSREKKKHETDLEIARVEIEIKNYSRRLGEEFSLSLKEASDYSIEMEDEEASGEIETLKSKMLGLGSVNTGAVEEHNRLLERVDFLKQQRDDLREAKNTIHKVIQELDGKMKDKFLDSFNQVKTIFSSVFKDFFEGGRAYLKLTDSNDVLESGIEIIAQPPGKKLQNLNLMSGGEKALTAIALLFSIIKVKPTPFCILDEIDVSLDGMNLNRFLKYLKVLSSNTQFILITHRRNTMEAAGVLYGVTMEEPGVSKVFSLRLPEEKEKRVS